MDSATQRTLHQDAAHASPFPAKNRASNQTGPWGNRSAV